MSQGLAYPATFGTGLQPSKRIGLSDLLNANQSFVDKAQSVNQIRNVVAPQAAKKVAPQAVKKADSVFEAKKAPSDLSQYSSQLDNSEADFTKQINDYYAKLADPEYGFDTSEIEQQRTQALEQAKQDYGKARQQSLGVVQKQINQSDLSPIQKNLTQLATKDAAGQPLSFGETLYKPALSTMGALDNFAGGAVKETGRLAAAPAALQSSLQDAPLPIKMAGAAVENAMAAGFTPLAPLLLGGQYPLANIAVEKIGRPLFNQGNEILNSETAQMSSPATKMIAGALGGSIPYLAAEAATLGGAGLAVPLTNRIANPLLRRAAGAAVENALEEAAASPGGQYLETGKVDPLQTLKDVGIAGGTGALFGGAIEGGIQGAKALGNLPKVETVRGEGGANAATRTSSIRELLGEKPKTEKKAGISQYNQFISLSKQKIQELQKSDLPDKEAQIQVLQKQIYDANEQKRILLAEKLKIDQTSNTAEARKQLDEILNSQRSAPFQPNKSADSEFVNSSNTPQQPPSTPTGSLFDNQIPLKQDSTGKADVLDELQRYKSLQQNRIIGNGDSVTLTFASKEQKALYELGGKPKFSSRALGGQGEKTKSQLEEKARIREALKNRLGVDDAELRNLIEQTRNSVAQQVEAEKTKTSDIKLKETIPKKPIIPDAPKTQNPIIPDAQTGKAGGQFKVDEILSEYGNKKGGIDAANKWLAENKDTEAVQQWVKENKFTNQKQLDTFLSKRHKEVRTPIEQARQARIQEGKLENMEEKARGVIAADKLSMAKQEARTQELIEIARGDVKDPEVQKVRTSLAKQGIEWRESPTSKQSSSVEAPKTITRPPESVKQTVETETARNPDKTTDPKIENFTEVKVLNNEWQKLKEKHGEKKGKAIYDAALRLVNPNKSEIVEITQGGIVVKTGNKYLFKTFWDTGLKPERWTLMSRELDVTPEFTKTAQLPPPTSKQSSSVDPRSFAQTKEGLTGQEFQDVRRNLSIRPEESGYIPRAKESLKLKEEDSKIIDEAARVETTLKISETRAEKIKDRLKEEMVEDETLKVQVPKDEAGVLSPLAGKEVTIKIYGKNLKVYSKEAKELLDKLQKEQAEFKEKNPDLFTSKGTSESEDVLSIQTDHIDKRTDFDYTTEDKQKLGLEFLRNDLQYKISLAESKVLRNKISNDILTADRLRDLVSDTDRTAIFQRKKGGETRQLKEELTPEEQARAKEFKGIQKQIKKVEDNPASLLEKRNKELKVN